MEISEWDKLKEKWEKLSGLIYTIPTKIENGGFTLKTQQMFSVHTTPGKFEKATISGSFCLELGFRKTRTGKTHDCRKVFKDLHFRKCFLSAKPAFSYFSGSKCISGKLYFYDGLVWMIGLTVQDIAVLSNFSKVVWTSPQPFAGYPLLLHFPRVCINKERVF